MYKTQIVEATKEIRDAADKLAVPTSKHQLLNHCQQLASGTIASLIDKTDVLYQDADTVRSMFVDYVRAYYDDMQFKTWQDAWESYRLYVTGLFKPKTVLLKCDCCGRTSSLNEMQSATHEDATCPNCGNMRFDSVRITANSIKLTV